MIAPPQNMSCMPLSPNQLHRRIGGLLFKVEGAGTCSKTCEAPHDSRARIRSVGNWLVRHSQGSLPPAPPSPAEPPAPEPPCS